MTRVELRAKFDYTTMSHQHQNYLLRLVGWYSSAGQNPPERPSGIAVKSAERIENIAALICGKEYDINGKPA